MFVAPFDKPSAGRCPQPKLQTCTPSCRQSPSRHPGGAVGSLGSHGFPLEDCGNDDPEICAPRKDFREFVNQGERKMTMKSGRGSAHAEPVEAWGGAFQQLVEFRTTES
jgi:hypothetical protein